MCYCALEDLGVEAGATLIPFPPLFTPSSPIPSFIIPFHLPHPFFPLSFPLSRIPPSSQLSSYRAWKSTVSSPVGPGQNPSRQHIFPIVTPENTSDDNHWRMQNFNLGGHMASAERDILALGRPTDTANLHPWPVAVFSV